MGRQQRLAGRCRMYITRFEATMCRPGATRYIYILHFRLRILSDCVGAASFHSIKPLETTSPGSQLTQVSHGNFRKRFSPKTWTPRPSMIPTHSQWSLRTPPRRTRRCINNPRLHAAADEVSRTPQTLLLCSCWKNPA